MNARAAFLHLQDARNEFEEITRRSHLLNRDVVPPVNRILEGDTLLTMADRLTVVRAVVDAIKRETRHTAKVARALDVLRSSAALLTFVTMSANVRTH